MKRQTNEDIPRKTLELNFEVNLFNNRLKSHLDIKSVDLQLLEQLKKTTELIAKLMNDCKLIEAETLNINEYTSLFQLHRQLYCHTCNTAIKTDVVRIQEHISSKQHQQLSAKLAKKEQNKKKPVGTHVFTNSNLTPNVLPKPLPLLNDAAFKIKPVIPRESKENETPNDQKNGENPVSTGPATKLSKKVLTFLRDRDLSKLAIRLMEEGEQIKMSSINHTVIDSIKQALVPKYPNVKVYAFGSRVSGLGSKDSDLDLYIDLNNQYFKQPTNIDTSEFKNIEKLLKATKKWIEFISITGARTPILQAIYNPEQLPCDLSFTSGLSQ